MHDDRYVFHHPLFSIRWQNQGKERLRRCIINFDEKKSLIKALGLNVNYLQSYESLVEKFWPGYFDEIIRTFQLFANMKTKGQEP
jgi:hypothetical protein